MLPPLPLWHSIQIVPPGRWGVAVSGGADSVALLRLLLGRPDVTCHVIHLDHETRHGASTSDADFVRSLVEFHKVAGTFETRSDLEAQRTAAGTLIARGLASDPATADYPGTPHPNVSAHFRGLRLALFESVVQRHRLNGVLAAHHADDQAETVLLRLLRGSGYGGIAGIAPQRRVGQVTLLRPLLGVSQADLRAYLRGIGQDWREDASNQLDDYARNRVRKALADRPELADALRAVGASCAALNEWVGGHSAVPAERLRTADVSRLPDVLADALVSGWLMGQGVSADRLSPMHVSAIVRMCKDKAAPFSHAAPNQIIIRRRGGWIWPEGGGKRR